MKKKEYETMYKMENNHWWYKGLHELVESYIKKYSKEGELDILDAGCGTGRMMEILNKYGHIEGIDYSKDAVSFCKKRGLKNVKVENLNNWNSNDKLYDAIISLDVLYHTGIKNDIQIINKFYSRLNKNGILILNLPAFNILRRYHDAAVSGKKRYRKRATIKELKNSGFNIIKATYRLSHLFIIILFIIKPFEKLFHYNKKNKSDLKLLPLRLNKLLLSINRLENKLLFFGTNIPFGSSLFIVARK